MVLKKAAVRDCGKRLTVDFFLQDVLHVAPSLLGKILAVKQPSGEIIKYMITETEAYRGIEDRACHASKGKTQRTEVMFRRGGYVYVYFVYGMYWMLNIVTGPENEPQAALIRGIEGYEGPGKLTRALSIDGTFYGEDLTSSGRIWIEDKGYTVSYIARERVGINYAGQPWVDMPWRFILSP